MDVFGTRTHFVRARTTYLHGRSTDKMSTGANFIRAVLQIERSVNGPQNTRAIDMNLR